MRTKRGGQHGPRTHTTRPHRQGTTTNMNTCPVLKRTHGSKDRTPHQSDTTYTLALIVDTCRFQACASTRTSEPCPILAWTYGAVTRALGSLVKLVPRLLLHSQTVHSQTVPSTPTRKGRSHALPQYTYCITTNTTQSAAERKHYRKRRHS